MATIKDVAREAGVSVGTVSRFLNGVDIKEKNKKGITHAINKLNYRVNPIARGLKTNKTHTIGVLIYDLTSTYATTIVKSIEQKLFDYGYNIFVCDYWNNPELEIKKANLLIEKMVDGLIVFPCSYNVDYLHAIQESGIPVVMVNWGLNDFKCDHVLIDNINATYQAVEMLINHNHRRIGIINGPEDHYIANERLKGYKRVHKDYNIPLEHDLIKMKQFDREIAYDAFIQLMDLKIPPTAIIACNYDTTLGMIKGLNERKIHIPEELSVIGFDNLGLSDVVQQPLSIIVQPTEDIGKEVATLMLNRLKGNYDNFPSTLRLKTSFIVKNSIHKI